MNILQISSAGAKLCDEHGDSAGIALAFSLGQHLTLEFDLRTDETVNGALAVYSATNLSTCQSFYLALSNVWNAAATPLFLRTSGISVATRSGKTILSVELPDTGVTALVSALSGKSEAVFTCEIGGIDSSTLAVFIWQFQVTVRNRIYLGGNVPQSVSGDPAYLTAAQVRALIGDGVYFSSDSILFTGGTAPTATLNFNYECPLYADSYGIQMRYADGLKGYQLDNEYAIGVDYDYVQAPLIAGDGVTFDGNTIYAPLFTASNTSSINGGTVCLAVAPGTRYTGSCDVLVLTGVANSSQESEIVVTFAGTAASCGVTLPATVKYAGSLPTWSAGKSYCLSIRNRILVAVELNEVTQ